MRAGVLYNISLYTEEASGVSDAAFVQVYAKEESKHMFTIFAVSPSCLLSILTYFEM